MSNIILNVGGLLFSNSAFRLTLLFISRAMTVMNSTLSIGKGVTKLGLAFVFGDRDNYDVNY
jgi:hypothetical protein